jgi:H+-translocating NAD(P) transhydrogenase subunit alpha
MKVSVPKEVAEGERRVALVPEVAKRLSPTGIELAVESGAGEAAHHPDGAYEEAGVSVSGNGFDGDVVAKVAPPSAEEIGRLKQGSVLIGFLQPRWRPSRASPAPSRWTPSPRRPRSRATAPR